jgi:HSP20 family protein
MKIFPVTRFGTFGSDPLDMMSTFDKMFENYFNTHPVTGDVAPSGTSITTVPRANVVKKDNGYVIELAAPGFSRDEFHIDVESNTLSISVNTEDTQSYKDSLQMREYRYQNFSRSWTLPEGANIEGIGASYDAGILYISIPVEGIKESKRIIAVD